MERLLKQKNTAKFPPSKKSSLPIENGLIFDYTFMTGVDTKYENNQTGLSGCALIMGNAEKCEYKIPLNRFKLSGTEKIDAADRNLTNLLVSTRRKKRLKSKRKSIRTE